MRVADIKLGADGKARLSIGSDQISVETMMSYHQVCDLLAQLSSVHAQMEGRNVLSLVKEQQQSRAMSSDEVVVEMTYVGIHTKAFLEKVRMGIETRATLSRVRRMCALGDVTLGLDEAISLLERHEGVRKTTEALMTERASYQQSIEHIEREPDAYVAPDLARKWYQQQIERIQHTLDHSQAQLSTPDIREVEVLQ